LPGQTSCLPIISVSWIGYYRVVSVFRRVAFSFGAVYLNALPRLTNQVQHPHPNSIFSNKGSKTTARTSPSLSRS
jgi:hypothetical protein